MSRTFRSLRRPNFRRFFIGQAISATGTWMQSVTVGILVLRITDSGVAVGLTTVAQFGPLLLLGPWAGILSDRFELHTLLLRVNAAGAVVAAAFSVLVVGGEPPLWSVYLLATATGVVQALENPVRRVFVTELVEDDLLANATGLNSTVMISAEAIGLTLAGVMIDGPGIVWCFLLNSLSFLPQLALFAGMDRAQLRRQPRSGRTSGRLRAGLSFAWNDAEVRVVMLLLAAIGMFGFSAHTVVIPLLAFRDLHGDAGTLTFVLTGLSIGSLAGALASARRGSADLWFLARAAIAFGVLHAGLGLATSPALAAAIAVPVGFAVMISVSGMNAVIQLRTPPQLRGRVMAMVSIVLVGTSPIGGPVVGVIADRFGARTALAAGGGVIVVAGTIALRTLPGGALRRNETSRGRRRHVTRLRHARPSILTPAAPEQEAQCP